MDEQAQTVFPFPPQNQSSVSKNGGRGSFFGGAEHEGRRAVVWGRVVK